jgi:hypothetical protein
MSSQPPWVWITAGVLATILVFGYTGNLYAVPPIDRVLNPDSRNYWESEEEYIREIVDFCAEAHITLDRSSERVADRCIDSSIEEAVDRGYLAPGFDEYRRRR